MCSSTSNLWRHFSDHTWENLTATDFYTWFDYVFYRRDSCLLTRFCKFQMAANQFVIFQHKAFYFFLIDRKHMIIHAGLVTKPDIPDLNFT